MSDVIKETKKAAGAPFVEKKGQSGAPAIFDEKNLKKKTRLKEKKARIKSSIADLMPIVDITASGAIEMRDGEFMEILQLTSCDIYAENEEDRNLSIFSFTFFLQSYLTDLKIVPMNFPVDTSEQQRFIERKIQTVSNSIFIPFLEKKLNELKFIESHRTHREYYLFLYADTEYTLLNKVGQAERLLQRTAPVVRLTDEKKINILYKLSNLNTKNK